MEEEIKQKEVIAGPMTTSISVCDTSGYIENISLYIQNIYFKKYDDSNTIYVSLSANLFINETPVKHLNISDFCMDETFNEFNKLYTTLDKFLRYEYRQRKVQNHSNFNDYYNNVINKSINKMISHFNYVCDLKLRNANLLNHQLNHSQDKVSYLSY